MTDSITSFTTNLVAQSQDPDARLKAAAQGLEASFLAEMLKAAKFGEPRKSFGGGPGEEQFSSLFRAEIAKDMAQSGGIGLAEHLFETLKARQSGGGNV